MHTHPYPHWVIRPTTPKAETFASEHGIFWSSKAELNELLRLLGLRELPEL